MAGNSTNQQLQAGIAAAKSGDKALARQLLEGVLAKDERSELAWIWLATVVDTVQERRICLQRVLAINPRNDRARQALTQLGSSSSSASVSRMDAPTARRTPRSNRAYVIGIGVLVLVVIFVVSSLTDNRVVSIQVTNTPLSQADLTALYTPTPIPSVTPNIILVTAGAALTLPPTFTPAPTLTELPTLFPTATLFPLTQYTLFYTARDSTEPTFSLYQILADGSGEQKLADNVRDIAFDSTGQQVVFVRQVAATNSNTEATADPSLADTSDEIFIASVDDLDGARQVTQLGRASAFTPRFSPDDRTLVFVSNYTGNDEIFTFDLASGTTIQATNNTATDRDPSWSPDGTSLVFASDRDSPLYTDLYVLTFNPDGSNRTERLTDDTGSSYAPQFSPDGRRVVYLNDSNLVVMGIDGQRQTTLLSDAFEIRRPVWSVDGRYIAFVSNREDERFQMYFIEPPARTVTRLNRDEREVGSLEYRPDLFFRIVGQNN